MQKTEINYWKYLYGEQKQIHYVLSQEKQIVEAASINLVNKEIILLYSAVDISAEYKIYQR